MPTGHLSGRLNLAGTREFTMSGAGEQRRERLANYGRDWLTRLWDDAMRPVRGAGRDGVALAAVGSLARADGGPLSDYDLVLVHDGRSMSAAEITALADRIWYPVWDSGARLDHSVRTRAECRAVASADLSAAVGMLDLNWIAGDPVLVAGVRSSIARDWRSHARKRLPELRESLQGRHQRAGDLTTDIEPDLKEGRGGLRDMAMLRSLTAAWLADRPHGGVDEAYARLLDVRDALHVVTGRGRDRLGRQDQDGVAALLAEPDADAVLTRVVDSARSINFALDSTFRRASQSQRARTPRIGPRRPVLHALGYGLYKHDSEIVLGQRSVPGGDLLLLLRAAAVSARLQLPLAPATVANLTRDLHNPGSPWAPEIRDAFVDLLAAGPGLRQVWETLDLAGVVATWLPEWAGVRNRPQRNPVHRHTVDRHLVETVVEAAGHRAEVDRPDLLLVTALLHDIGKVAGARDHSEQGAPVAAIMARRMGFVGGEVDMIELLVREHLTLVELATRRDPGDPATIAALLTTVGGRRDVLEQLAVLTESDAIAAGPKAWTPWRAELVGQLLAAGRSALGEQGVVPDEVAEPVDVTALLGPEALARLASGSAHVEVQRSTRGASIQIADRDRQGLFADCASLLSAAGVVVRSARLRTVEGVAVDTWEVECPGQTLPDAADLTRGLAALAKGDRTPLRGIERRSERLRSVGSPSTRATVIPGGSAEATVLEVRSTDRPGLLHNIGMTLAAHELTVRSAHVATYAGQSLDTFYVTAADGCRVEPPAVGQVIAALIDTCDAVD